MCSDHMAALWKNILHREGSLATKKRNRPTQYAGHIVDCSLYTFICKRWVQTSMSACTLLRVFNPLNLKTSYTLGLWGALHFKHSRKSSYSYSSPLIQFLKRNFLAVYPRNSWFRLHLNGVQGWEYEHPTSMFIKESPPLLLLYISTPALAV